MLEATVDEEDEPAGAQAVRQNLSDSPVASRLAALAELLRGRLRRVQLPAQFLQRRLAAFQRLGITFRPECQGGALVDDAERLGHDPGHQPAALPLRSRQGQPEDRSIVLVGKCFFPIPKELGGGLRAGIALGEQRPVGIAHIAGRVVREIAVPQALMCLFLPERASETRSWQPPLSCRGIRPADNPDSRAPRASTHARRPPFGWATALSSGHSTAKPSPWLWIGPQSLTQRSSPSAR